MFGYRRLVFLSLSLAVLTSGCQPQLADPNPSYSLIIDNVTVVDAASGLREAQTVALRGDKIATVMDAEGTTWPANQAVIDGRGKFLIPGLWDMHVHLGFEPELGSAMMTLFIANGITGVRDTGGDLVTVLAAKAEASRRGATAPQVFVAGPLLDGQPTVYDGSAPGFPAIGIGLDDPEAATAKVAQLSAAGVDLIKAYEMLSPESYRAVVTAARKHGLPVTGHIPLSMDPVEALNTGLSSIEHLRNVELGCSSDKDDLLTERKTTLRNPDGKPGRSLRGAIHRAQRNRAIANFDAQQCQRVIDAIVANQVAQVPTLALIETAYERVYATDHWQQTFAQLPVSYREQWFSNAAKFAEGAKRRATPESDANSAAYMNWVRSTIKSIHENGGTILAGTDTPIFFMTPGPSLHRELQSFVAAGLEPIDALASATSSAAEYFGLGDQEGFVGPGANANLVLLDANPLQHIANTEKIAAVIRAGVVHDRAALDRMLDAVSRANPH